VAPKPLTYTVAQLAQRLQISPGQIRRLREAGEFPFDPLPGIGAVRFSRLEVERRLTGACQVRCLWPDAFSRAARLFCEVEGGEDWPETAGLVQSVHSEGPNGWNRRAL